MHISLNKKRISLLRDWGFLPARQQPTRLTLYVPFVGDIILEGQICNLVSGQVSTFNLTDLTGSGGCGWPLKTGLQLVSEFWEALMCYTGVHCHLSECNWVGENCENLGILVETNSFLIASFTFNCVAFVTFWFVPVEILARELEYKYIFWFQFNTFSSV